MRTHRRSGEPAGAESSLWASAGLRRRQRTLHGQHPGRVRHCCPEASEHHDHADASDHQSCPDNDHARFNEVATPSRRAPRAGGSGRVVVQSGGLRVGASAYGPRVRRSLRPPHVELEGAPARQRRGVLIEQRARQHAEDERRLDEWRRANPDEAARMDAAKRRAAAQPVQYARPAVTRAPSAHVGSCAGDADGRGERTETIRNDAMATAHSDEDVATAVALLGGARAAASHRLVGRRPRCRARQD